MKSVFLLEVLFSYNTFRWSRLFLSIPRLYNGAVLVKRVIAVTDNWEKENKEGSCIWAHNPVHSQLVLLGTSHRRIILGERSGGREMYLLGS